MNAPNAAVARRTIGVSDLRIGNIDAGALPGVERLSREKNYNLCVRMGDKGAAAPRA